MIIQALVMFVFEVLTRIFVMPIVLLLAIGIHTGIAFTNYAVKKMEIDNPGVVSFRTWTYFVYSLSRQLLMVFLHFPVTMFVMLLIFIRVRFLKGMVYSRYNLMKLIGIDGEDYLATATEKLRNME